MSRNKYDIVVAGSGPAGLAIAGHCAGKGLKTACVSPDIDERWENNYGVWKDEIKELDIEDTFNHAWDKADFIFNEKSTRTFEHTYIQFDRDKLKAKLISQGGERNLNLIKDKLEKFEHGDTYTRLYSENNDQYESAIVIDASGFEPVFLKRPGKKADVMQVAYGVMAKVDKHPYPVDHFTMMDFRYEFLKGDDYPPAICYVMPFSNDTIFFEETSVVDRPGVKMELLQDRLRKRLEYLDVKIKEKEWEEFCYIPTNPPLPDFKQRVIGLGAGAGLIHANTGYSVAVNLNLAPALADTIYEGLNASNASLDSISQKAWNTLWTPQIKRMDVINRLGMELFCKINIRQLSFLMRMFFSFPDQVWQGYLSNDTSISKIMKGFLFGYKKK